MHGQLAGTLSPVLLKRLWQSAEGGVQQALAVSTTAIVATRAQRCIGAIHRRLKATAGSSGLLATQPPQPGAEEVALKLQLHFGCTELAGPSAENPNDLRSVGKNRGKRTEWLEACMWRVFYGGRSGRCSGKAASSSRMMTLDSVTTRPSISTTGSMPSDTFIKFAATLSQVLLGRRAKLEGSGAD